MRRLAALLLLVAAPALAETKWAVGPGGSGFCAVSPRQDVDLDGRSLVVCRYTGPDLTGDGQPEVIETILTLNRRGGIDCERSAVVTLDVSLERKQAIAVERIC